MSLTKVSYSMIQGECINVIDYGVSSANTAAQNDAAFASAIAAAKNKTLYIPAGEYDISATLLVTYDGTNSCTNIIGEGRGSKLVWVGAASTPMIQYVGVSGAGFYAMTVIEKIYLHGSASIAGVTGIKLGVTGVTDKGVGNVTIQNVEIDYVNTGISSYFESDEVTIQNCHIRLYTQAAIINLGGSGYRIIGNHLQDGEDGSLGIYSIGTGITILGNVIQSGSINGINLVNVSGFSVQNNYSESQTGGDYFVKYEGSNSGYTSGNLVGGYPGANLYDIDATCHGLEFGPNFHGQSGGYLNHLFNIASINNLVTFSGEQYTDATVFIGGDKVNGAITAGLYNGSWIGPKLSSLPQGSGLIQTTSGSTTILTLTAGQTYLICASLSDASKSTITALVQCSAYTPSTATITNLAYTDLAKLSVAASGLNISLVNGTGVPEAISYNATRIM